MESARNVTEDVVEIEVAIAARPETVFAFLTDPAKMTRWMGSMAELDPRPGGVLRVAVRPGATGRGEYVAVEPFHRVVFTWGWEEPDLPIPAGASTIEISLTPDGDRTLLRLIHRDIPEPIREIHREGWVHYLSRLAVAVTGGDPGPDSLSM
jgi:uncharacterized protein YndB with AHSA1/START domain